MNFRTGREIPVCFSSDEQVTCSAKKSKRGRPLEEERGWAFKKVIEYFEENDEEQLTIMHLTNKMAEILEHSNCEPYTSWYLKKKIIERFGDDVVIAEIDGRPDVITMRPTVAKILHNFYYEPKEDSTHREEIRLVKAAATMIKNDIKRHDGSKETYPLSSDMSSVEIAISFLPESLILLLDTLIIGVDKKFKIASIGQAIMQATRPRVLIAPPQLD